MHITLQSAIIAALVGLALAATPALARPVDRSDPYDSPTLAEPPTPHVVTAGPTAVAATRHARVRATA
jgi:hypothetical protein